MEDNKPSSRRSFLKGVAATPVLVRRVEDRKLAGIVGSRAS